MSLPDVPVPALLSALGACVVGVVFLLTGWRAGRVPDATGWWRVPGTIVAWEDGGHRGRGTDVRYPVVEYPLPDGALHRLRMPTTFDTGRYRTGVPVTVLVDPADPRRAQLPASTVHALLLRVVFWLLGSMALVGGLVALVVIVRLG